MKGKMLKLETFGHIIQYALYINPYCGFIMSFFSEIDKHKCKSVLGHWYGLFIKPKT